MSRWYVDPNPWFVGLSLAASFMVIWFTQIEPNRVVVTFFFPFAVMFACMAVNYGKLVINEETFIESKHHNSEVQHETKLSVVQ